jgi:hypothetical protein
VHILQLCPRVPFPPHDGGAIAMYDVAAGLACAGHRVTVLAANTPKHQQPADVLSHLPGVRLIAVPVDTRLKPLKALKNLLLGKVPYNVERFINPQLVTELQRLLRTERFDVVQVEGAFVAWYVDIIRAEVPNLPVVLRAHNVEHTIWRMLAERESNPIKVTYLHHLANGLKRFEEKYLPRFDAVAAITAPDQRRLRAMGCPEPVAFIPAGVELSRFQMDATIQAKPGGARLVSGQRVALRARAATGAGATHCRQSYARAPAASEGQQRVCARLRGVGGDLYAALRRYDCAFAERRRHAHQDY